MTLAAAENLDLHHADVTVPSKHNHRSGAASWFGVFVVSTKRARGSDEDSIGCGKAYLEFIGIIIAIPLAITILKVIADNIGFIVSALLIVAGVLFIGFAIQERSQIKSWLASVEDQIEQWTHDEKRFTIVVVFSSSLICLIFAILGIVFLQRMY